MNTPDEHPLGQRMEKHRERMRLDSSRIKRARRLYVRFCRSAIACDRTTATLNYCAERMAFAGMYQFARPLRETRYSILRMMFKLDAYRGMTWHKWYQANGWQPYTWERTHLRLMA